MRERERETGDGKRTVGEETGEEVDSASGVRVSAAEVTPVLATREQLQMRDSSCRPD